MKRGQSERKKQQARKKKNSAGFLRFWISIQIENFYDLQACLFLQLYSFLKMNNNTDHTGLFVMNRTG